MSEREFGAKPYTPPRLTKSALPCSTDHHIWRAIGIRAAHAKYGMLGPKMPAPSLKPVIWLGDSLRELKEFPAAVQDEMGYAIYLAQCGQKHV